MKKLILLYIFYCILLPCPKADNLCSKYLIFVDVCGLYDFCNFSRKTGKYFFQYHSSRVGSKEYQFKGRTRNGVFSLSNKMERSRQEAIKSLRVEKFIIIYPTTYLFVHNNNTLRFGHVLCHWIFLNNERRLLSRLLFSSYQPWLWG